MKKIALAILTVIVCAGVGPGVGSAFNENDLQKLKTTKNCVQCDLSGAVLIHWNLSGADLSGANLSGTNLSEAFMAGANLSGANLSNAILSGASLARANLVGAKLSASNLFMVDLTRAAWIDGSRCQRRSVGWCKK